MSLDPEVAAVVGALVFAVAIGLPSLQRRARAVRECVNCGRIRVLGERTCDCGD